MPPTSPAEGQEPHIAAADLSQLPTTPDEALNDIRHELEAPDATEVGLPTTAPDAEVPVTDQERSAQIEAAAVRPPADASIQRFASPEPTIEDNTAAVEAAAIRPQPPQAPESTPTPTATPEAIEPTEEAAGEEIDPLDAPDFLEYIQKWAEEHHYDKEILAADRQLRNMASFIADGEAQIRQLMGEVVKTVDIKEKEHKNHILSINMEFQKGRIERFEKRYNSLRQAQQEKNMITEVPAAGPLDDDVAGLRQPVITPEAPRPSAEA